MEEEEGHGSWVEIPPGLVSRVQMGDSGGITSLQEKHDFQLADQCHLYSVTSSRGGVS